MQDFHKILVWQKAHALVLRIYAFSGNLPPSENLGLTSMIRRAAVAIPRAIAEGAVRGTSVEFAADLRKARAAASELEYLLLLCADLSFLASSLHDELHEQLTEVSKMISGLLRTVASEPVR